MSDSELKNLVVTWLWKRNAEYKTRPCRFSPKEITDQVGGVHTSLGRIQGEIVSELKARGAKIQYLKTGSRRYFELR